MGCQVSGGEGCPIQEALSKHQDICLQVAKAICQAKDQEEGNKDREDSEAGQPDGYSNIGSGTEPGCANGAGGGKEDYTA